jgi:hypothetical protein
MGRKRHIIVDTLGLLIGLIIHAADIQDRDGAPMVVQSTSSAGHGCAMSLLANVRLLTRRLARPLKHDLHFDSDTQTQCLQLATEQRRTCEQLPF